MNSEGIYSKVVTRVYDYEEVYEYSYDQAVSMLTTILVKNKTISYGIINSGSGAAVLDGHHLRSRVLHLGEIRLPGDSEDGGGPESIHCNPPSVF